MISYSSRALILPETIVYCTFVCSKPKMDQQQMTPVEEVEMFLNRERIRTKIDNRQNSVMHTLKLAAEPVPPPQPPLQRMNVEQSSAPVINLLEQSVIQNLNPAKSVLPQPPTEKMNVEHANDKPVIDLLESADEEDTIDYSNDTTDYVSVDTIPYAEAAPCVGNAIARVQQQSVPKTLENLWLQIKAERAEGILESERCDCKSCPYCSGPLMLQRFVLMQRLVVLDKMLWGV